MLLESQAYDDIRSVCDVGQAIVHYEDSAGGCLIGCEHVCKAGLPSE